MLNSIHLKAVGPAPELKIDFAQRLNFLTGDNGLGKSFLLDTAWWVLTRTWARGVVAVPHPDAEVAKIAYSYTKVSADNYDGESKFRRKEYTWRIPQGRPAIPGIVIYAGVDGSFSVWDPARNYWRDADSGGPERPPAFNFTPEEVWKGAYGPDGTRYCNGLIHDWVSWQRGKRRVLRNLPVC